MVLAGADQSIPADGYLRSMCIEVTASGGDGAATLAADAPWNIFQSVKLSDVNGAPIYGPISGYNAYLSNKYGGYFFRGDPKTEPGYSSTANNPSFMFRVPVEINRQTGFGAIGNQNASATYKLELTLNTIANIWSSAPATTIPTFRIRGFLETWSQPLPFDAANRPQQVSPPWHGTTQFWSVAQFTINGGEQAVTLTRVGNLIRSFVLVYRDATGARVAVNNMPDPLFFEWDARSIRADSRRMIRQAMADGQTADVTSGAAQVDTGVMVYMYDTMLGGHWGGGNTDKYLPTVQSTRMNFRATWPVAGVLEVLTNDVAPVETDPRLKYAESSATGFHPQVGTPIPGAGG